VHRTLTLPASVDAFYAGLSSKVRKNLRWQAKKLLQDFSGDVRVHCFRQATELDRMFAEVERVAQKTYQRGLGVGFADNAEMRQRMHFEAEKGWLRVFALYVKEQLCAFWIGTQYGEVFHSNFMGYDAEYGKYSPGMFLVVRVIEDFCSQNQNVRQIDFGLGDAQYKEVLGNQEWQEASVHIFGPSLRGCGLNALQVPVMLLDRAARKVLQETKLLARIKKFWRERLRPRSK
jgi:CelD/BcsL family acetyltransferase involved in cellulose biosynthesis